MNFQVYSFCLSEVRPYLNICNLTCCGVVLLTTLFGNVDDWFVIPVGFRIDDAAIVEGVTDDVWLVIVAFDGFLIVDEGGFSLLEVGTFFNGCFKRDAFVIVVLRLLLRVRFGSCETDLLLFFARLPLRAFELAEVVFWLIRTVEADDAVLLDDELLIKRWDGGECVWGLIVTTSFIVSFSSVR